MLYKVGLTFKSVDEILVCDHLTEQYLCVALVVLLYKVIFSYKL